MFDYIKRQLHDLFYWLTDDPPRPAECPITEVVPNDLPTTGEILVNYEGDYINMDKVTMLARYIEWDWQDDKRLSNYRTITMYKSQKGMYFYVEQRKVLATGKDALRKWHLDLSHDTMMRYYFKAVIDSNENPTLVRFLVDNKVFKQKEI